MTHPHRSTLIAAQLLACTLALPGAACNASAAGPGSTGAPAFDASNPFASASTLPFQAPPFNRIKDSDFTPALDEGMRQELVDVDAIARSPETPTFLNTIEAMERRGELLRRVLPVFFGLTSSNKNAVLQQAQTDAAPKFAAHQDAIYLNAALFARIKTVFTRRMALGLTPEARYLVERYYHDFVHAGALMSEGDKKTVRALNEEESRLSDEFSNRILADSNASALVLAEQSELAGLSESDVAAAAAEASARGLAGKWVLTLQNITQQPALQQLENRAVRQRLLEAAAQRGGHAGANDTREIILRLAALRAQRSKVLGYPSYADSVLDDQMAQSPGHVSALLAKLVTPAVAKANREAQRLQEFLDAQHAGYRLQPWDWRYVAEHVRRADFNLDDADVRPYFELDRVLHDGLFYAATQLYGLTFKERRDLPVYQPDVRVFEVIDADGSSIALFYADLFARPNKNGGAWTSGFVDRSGLLGTRAVVTNIENLSRPAPGQPKLLSFDEVTTLFHEFGHALQRIMSNARYPTSPMPRDFAEAPAMFNEHWALHPSVLVHYAKHYQTGTLLPQSLIDKIKAAREFNQGFIMTELLEAALLDMAWHSIPATQVPTDAEGFERGALERYHADEALIPPRYHSAYFSHIWSNGYAAGYYAYLWSEVIADDAFAWFTDHGGMTRKNGQRFRELALARAGAEDAAAMYRRFRGADAALEPLLQQRGLLSSGKIRKPSNAARGE